MGNIILSIIIWLGVIGNAYLGILVYLKNPKRIVNQFLSLLALISSLWGIGLYFFEHPAFMSSELWLRWVYIIVIAMVTSFFGLSLVFPRIPTKQSYWRPLLLCTLTGVPFAYVILFTRLFLQRVVQEPWGFAQILGPIYPLYGLWTTVFGLWALVNYAIKYKTSRGIERLQLRYVFLGMTFFCLTPLTLDVVFPVLLHNSKYIWTSPIGAIFIVGPVSYTIIRHRLLDIRFLVARSIAYLFSIVFVGVLYVGGMVALMTILSPGPLNIPRMITSTILTLAIALSFQPVLWFFQKATVRIFYKDYYTIDAFLGGVSQVMATKLELNALMCGVLDVVHKYLHATSSTIIVHDKEYDYIIESSSILSLHMSIVKEDLAVLKQGNKLLVYEEMGDSKQKELMRKHDIGLFMPLATQHATIGYLLLGEKASGDVYFSQDVKALQIMAPELAIALENAQSYEKIKIFNETLKVEVAKATRDVRLANIHLKQLDRLKDEFISIASHELRTPLTTVKGFLELELKDPEKLAYESRNHLERAYASSQRMIALVGDMLDVSRIESGRLTLTPAPCNLGELARTVVADEEAHIKVKHASVRVEGEGVTVTADPARVHQILLNLVDNALKFIGENGSVVITCKDVGAFGEIAVSDTGPGIRKEDFPRLFTKFGKLGMSYSSMSETQGTGLGLYICKKLVELQQGKISVTSVVGKGSTFSFTLPKVLPAGRQDLSGIKKSDTLTKEAHGT